MSEISQLGARLYPVKISASYQVAAIAAHNVTMLINKTPHSIRVSLNGTLVTLAPSQVRIANQ